MYGILDVCTLLFLWNFAFLEFFQKPPGGWRTTARRLMHFYVFWGSWKRNCLAAHSQSPCDARSLNQFMGLLMKRLAGLVEPSGGSGQSDSFWVFWNSGLNLIGAKVSGDSYGLLMMANGGYNHVIKGLNEWNNVYDLGLNVWYLYLRFEMSYRELDIGIVYQCN